LISTGNISVYAFNERFRSADGTVVEKELRLIVAGSGSALESIKNYVAETEIPNVDFVGFVSGIEKIKVFRKSQFFIFPSGQEGLPVSLLEAMCFGLPIFCIATGGIKDFFQNGEMGILQNSLDIPSGSTQIVDLLRSPDKLIEVGRFNHIYAKKHFLASDNATKLEALIKSNLND